MPKQRQYVYWDSCSFLSYLNKEPGRVPVLDAILQEVADSRGDLCIATSMVAKTEVAFAATERANGALDPAIEASIDALWEDDNMIALVDFHAGIADLARDLMRKAITFGIQLKALDAIHLATAEWIQATKVHTYDKVMIDCQAITSLRISEPEVLQPTLPLEISGP